MHDIEIIINGIKCLKRLAELAENAPLVSAVEALKLLVDELITELTTNENINSDAAHEVLENITITFTPFANNCNNQNTTGMLTVVENYISELQSLLPE